MSKLEDDAIFVNGEAYEWGGGPLAELLTLQGLDSANKGFAVAVNARVIRREEWRDCHIAPGDKVEIVSMYKGG